MAGGSSSTRAAWASRATASRTSGWMLLDTDAGTATWRRTAYDISEVQAAMSRLGLPDRLVARLAYGL